MATSPYLTSGISDDFLPLKYVTPAGPIIVAVEKAALQFDPSGSEPEGDDEWQAIANAIAKTLEPMLPDLCQKYDTTRMQGYSTWKHVDLTRDRLAGEGIDLRSNAHHMLRQSTYQRR